VRGNALAAANVAKRFGSGRFDIDTIPGNTEIIRYVGAHGINMRG
jgi:hypothetical protein